VLDRRRRAIQDGVKCRGRRPSAKGLPSRRHFVQHRTNRKQIAAPVEVLAARLFRRHVRDGAERGPRARQADVRGAVARSTRAGRGLLGQPEVEQLGVTATGHENIRRLDVAMDDIAAVRGVERIDNLHGEVEQFLVRQRLAANPVLQRLALEQFHHDERLAVVLADLVNHADVGMIQRRRGARFAREALERRLVLRHFRGQELQGDGSAERHVLGFVHHAHTPAAEAVLYAIA
jgi:hypothetical protein